MVYDAGVLDTHQNVMATRVLSPNACLRFAAKLPALAQHFAQHSLSDNEQFLQIDLAPFAPDDVGMSLTKGE
jgi:hypothetical protein